jgi:hypothetical protein
MVISAATADSRVRGSLDYAIVKGRIREAGLLEKQPWFYARSICAKLILLAACLAVFVLLRNPWRAAWPG